MSRSRQFLYAKSSELPERVQSRVKPDYLKLIDKGNEFFFAPLSDSFPETFKTLCSLEPIKLLELEIERTTAMGESATEYLYYWSMELTGSKSLICNIPRYAMDSKRRKSHWENYYSKLPDTFAGFFHHMDGGKIGEYPVFTGTDFPNGQSEWSNIHSYYENKEALEVGDDIALEDNLPGSEPRVVTTLRNQDFLICLLSSASNNVFLVRKESPTEAEVLANPGKALDKYLHACLDDPDDKSLSLAQ